MQACERLGPEHKFDAVVVDEGQDFHELWWTSLESVFRDPDDKGCYYVFFDPNQNLYVEDPCLPEGFGQPYVLPENCRNTVRIAAHCASLLGDESGSRDGAPMGDEPEIVHARTIEDAFREAGPACQTPVHAQPGRAQDVAGCCACAGVQQRGLAGAIWCHSGYEEL